MKVIDQLCAELESAKRKAIQAQARFDKATAEARRLAAKLEQSNLRTEQLRVALGVLREAFKDVPHPAGNVTPLRRDK